MIDSHLHLTMMDDPDKVILEAMKEGVVKLLTIGTDLEDSKRVLEMARSRKMVLGSIGIHPHESKSHGKKEIEGIAKLTGDGIVAIGEIGLDYFKNYSPKEDQIRVFGELLDLAEEKKLPVVIHTRAADNDTYTMLSQKRGKIRGVIHCFSSDREFAKKVLDLGFYISFAGNITYKKGDKAREMLSYVPLDRLLLETDAPFLAPHPFRGKPNRPSYIRYTYSFVSDMMNLDIEKLKESIKKNFHELFGA